MKKIVIDPGHGGRDPGAAAFGLKEKDITLDIARRTRDALGAYQAEVILTRDGDIDLDLPARAAVANKLVADYFLSIHVNAGGGTGFESYVHIYAGEKSRAIRDVIHARVSDFYRSAGFGDRGKKSANFAVLRLTNMPAVLLENLFIDQEKDAARLAEPDFRQGIADAIASGLVDALGLRPVNHPVNHPVDNPVEPQKVDLSMSGTAQAVIIRVGGKTIPGFILDGKTYGPVRDIADALGRRVAWYESDKLVYIE